MANEFYEHEDGETPGQTQRLVLQFLQEVEVRKNSQNKLEQQLLYEVDEIDDDADGTNLFVFYCQISKLHGQGQISDDVYQKLYQQILPRVQQYH